MSSFRLGLAVLLVLAVPIGGLTGCGQSEEQKRAIEANDVLPTTDQAAEAARQQEIAKNNEALDAAERKDRKGLAKDVVDAVDDAATGAETDAKKRAADAQSDAEKAAAAEIAKAQDEAAKVREEVQKRLDSASDTASDAISDALKSTSP